MKSRFVQVRRDYDHCQEQSINVVVMYRGPTVRIYPHEGGTSRYAITEKVRYAEDAVNRSIT